MSEQESFGIPGVAFPIGTEYYRAPAPRPDVWDADFARIRAAGMHVVRVFNYWNWYEPRPGQYEVDDLDLLFDLAAKHDLHVWLDVPIATHGSCPDWLIRDHPDMRVVNYLGQPVMPDAHRAYPHGAMIHCYDHPLWREYSEQLFENVIGHFKDHPSMLVWGIWDGVNLSSAWTRMGGGYPCYCDSTLARYYAWLRARYSLDELNERVQRRYRRWEDVEAPRSDQNVVEMLLYKQFHYENLAGHLAWAMGTAKRIDPVHEMRAHGGWVPRPWDEHCAPISDSWGMSMSANNLLTIDDPHLIADRAFGFDWSRVLGKNGRWWNEEIYAGMSPGGVTWKRQSDPREQTMLLWMTLIGGAVGSMFWQYRPEYMTFESPGYNMVALDGEPTPRFREVVRVVKQIEGLSGHLPLEIPGAEVAVVSHQQSQELFSYDGELDVSGKTASERFLADLRGVYRTLWRRGIAADPVTPKMDWSGYRLVVLPNTALMTDELRERLERTLAESPETHFLAEGSFGLYSPDGQSSYAPPEGFAERFGVRVADFSAVTEREIEQRRNVVETPHGALTITTPCGYAALEPLGDSQAIASLGDETIGIRSGDGRLTWYGMTLSAGFADVAHPVVVEALLDELGIGPSVAVEGDPIVPVVRGSSQGGRLVFLHNLGREQASATLRPTWSVTEARDLLADAQLDVSENAFQVTLEPWSVGVVHCPEA